MRAVFDPLGWTVNKVEHDYGVDFDVEVFRDGQSTGMSFRIQLKSSNSTPYSAGSDFISQEISLDSAKYLCAELRGPVILVHADVESGRTFWLAPQLDINGIKKLSRGSSTVTLRIPTTNELPATIGRMAQAVAQAEKLLATRVMLSSPVPDFVSSITGHVPMEATIRSFREKSDALRIQLAQDLLRGGERGRALDSIRGITTDPASSTEMKFSALLMKERVLAVALARDGAPQAELPKMYLASARALQQLTKKGPRYLKFYALIAKKAAQLDTLVHADWGLFLNWRITQRQGDTFWGTQLVFQRAVLSRRIARVYNQCIRLVRHAANAEDRWALPNALLRIVQAIGIFIIRLRQEEMTSEASRYAASALQICRLAAWIAADSDDENVLPFVVTAASSLAQTADGETVDWVREVMNGIKDERARQVAQLLFDRHMQRMRGEEVEDDIPATARQVIENMAMALGIDMSNPEDPQAKLVERGIVDANPGRVLKNCAQIFITLAPQPPLAPTALLARMLGLPSIGPKMLHCDKHGYRVRDAGLDSAYALFKSRYYDKCPDAQPRPPDWEYSDDWQQEENLRHAESVEAFFRTVDPTG